MLYDPKWNAKKAATKANPFSVENVVAWLETKPASQVYVWDAQPDDCGGGCLIHQYLGSISHHPTDDYQRIACLETTGPHKFFDGDVAMESPFTFGAALNRAREYAPRII